MSYTFEQHQPMQHSNMAYSPPIVDPQAFYMHNQSPPTIHPGQLGLPALGSCNMFISGFTDCAQEALRYLIEVERLPYNHPMVIGLQNHLYEQQRIHAMKFLLQNMMLQEQHTNTLLTHGEHQTDCLPSVQNTNASDDENTNASDDEGIDRNSIEFVLKQETDKSNRLEVDTSGNVQSSWDQLSRDESSRDELQGLSEHTEKLVSELAEEIFSLLDQGDDDESDYDDYDEDVDEGFEEIDH